MYCLPRRYSFVLVCSLTVGSLVALPVHADRIILRSLQIITDRTVVSFDDEGVVLDHQQRLGWHEIERATIAPGKQAAFDQSLQELGAPLYRLRQRLTTADYEGVLQPAESLYPRFAAASSDTAYLVAQAVMWGRMAAGKREAAVEPYWRCFEILRARPNAATALPGPRRLQFDAQTGFTTELMPVWFNSKLAREALPVVYRQIAEMRKPRPDAAAVYYTTLAIAAGDQAAAQRVLAAIPSDQPNIQALRDIVEAQLEVVNNQPGVAVAKLGLTAAEMNPELQPLAWYWLGLAQLREETRETQQAGMLQLLRIPALAGRRSPELAGAALYHVLQTLAAQGDAAGSVAVRRELLERYGQTYYALQVRGVTTGTEKKS